MAALKFFAGSWIVGEVMIKLNLVIPLTISRSGTNVDLSWSGGGPPYVVQQAGTLPASSWDAVLTTNAQTARFPIANTNLFFRIKTQ